MSQIKDMELGDFLAAIGKAVIDPDDTESLSSIYSPRKKLKTIKSIESPSPESHRNNSTASTDGSAISTTIQPKLEPKDSTSLVNSNPTTVTSAAEDDEVENKNNNVILQQDVLKIEHTVRNIQNFLKKLLDEAPTLEEYNKFLQSDFNDEETLIALKRNNNVKLASHLKSLYNDGKLKLFDEIIKFNPNFKFSNQITSDAIEALNPISIEPSLPSPLPRQAELLQIEVDSEEQHTSLVKFNGKFLPPLPKIQDPSIYARVFMHKSVINDKVYLNDWEMVTSHNERLEFLGDSVLNTVMTMIIYKRFEHLSEGDLSKIRTQLINNDTLAQWALEYEFDKLLKKNISDNVIRRGKMKIFADVFEAYVGGLTLEHGSNLSVINSWLEKLAEPTLVRYDLEVLNIEPLNKSAKAELYALIGSASQSPCYITISTGNGLNKPFIVKCVIGTDELGVGIAPNVKEAGLRAAMNALKNKEMIEKYMRIRGELPRSQSRIKQIPSLLRGYEADSLEYRPEQPNSAIQYPQPSSESSSSAPVTAQNTGGSTIYHSTFHNGFNPQSMPLQYQQPSNPQFYQPQLVTNNSQFHLGSGMTSVPSYTVPQHTSTQGMFAPLSQKLVLPIHADPASPIDSTAKNSLYALLGKVKRTPAYNLSQVGEGFKVDLVIGDKIYATAQDRNKKQASARAAMALLSNSAALRELGVTQRIP